MKRLVLLLTPTVFSHLNFFDVHHKRGVGELTKKLQSRSKRDLNTVRGQTLRYLEVGPQNSDIFDAFDADFDEEESVEDKESDRVLRKVFDRSNITDGESCESFRLCATNKLVF